MIHSAALKLTIWYLAIIMALSISFSVALFNIYSADLSKSLGGQPKFLTALPDDYIRGFRDYRDQQLSDSENRMVRNLVLFNLSTLVFGGLLSYGLARRTLRPIGDAFEAQSRFSSDASHELRTPLTAMQTEIEVALRNKDITKAQALDLLRSNLEEVAKLRALSEGLLKLSRSHVKELVLQPLDLETVMADVIDRVIKPAQVKDMTVENEVGSHRVIGDHQSLVELLVILIDNAIKYSNKKTKIRVQAELNGKQVLVHVIDHGRGIDNEQLPHIFERFYRVDSSRTKENGDGYGLGLSIAEMIAKAHGAQLSVKSTVGKGSIFTVILSAAV